MPVLNVRIDHLGRPIVELYVAMGTTHADARREVGDPVPGIVPVNALVDTGAGQTQVSLSIIEALGLEPVGEVNLFTASTGDPAEVMDVYVVDLACAGDRPGPMAEDLRVIGSPKLSGLKVDMLLGRDVLDGCLLA